MRIGAKQPSINPFGTYEVALCTNSTPPDFDLEQHKVLHDDNKL